MGYKYEIETVIIRKIKDKPEFGIIKKIYLIENLVRFKVKKLKTNEFNKHYGAYDVYYNENNDIYMDYENLPKFVPCLYVKNFVATRFWI